jgi:hypothetical protein
MRTKQNRTSKEHSIYRQVFPSNFNNCAALPNELPCASTSRDTSTALSRIQAAHAGKPVRAHFSGWIVSHQGES